MSFKALDYFLEGRETAVNIFSNNDVVYVTYTNWQYVELAKNWYFSLNKVQCESNVIVICADIESYSVLLEANIPCVRVDEQKMLSEINFYPLDNFFKHGHLKVKNFIFYDIVKKYEKCMLYTDVDVVFLRNPTEILLKESQDDTLCLYVDKTYDDLFLQIDHSKEEIGYGGYPVVLTPSIVKRLCDCYAVIDIDLNLISMASIKPIFNTFCKIKELNTLQFTNKSMWDKVDMRRLAQKTAYAVHYNNSVYGGVDFIKTQQLQESIEVKILQMKQNNHWFL